MKKSSKAKYIPAIGRRKTATARIRLFEKKGPIIVNNQTIEKYFPGEVNKIYYQEPFRVTNTKGKLMVLVIRLN